MNEQIILTDKKVLEFNERAYQDTLQLLESAKNPFNYEELKARLDLLGESYENSLCMTHLDKGRTCWLQITVKDSYMSRLIYAWMFSKSNQSGQSGLQAFGCSLDALHYEKPSGFTEEQKDLIKKLYEAAFQ